MNSSPIQLKPIKVLPLDVSALLAAGQVIDSLGAVVRELVENSLDAGANRLVISIWPELWRLQVVDNGCGMSLEDLRLACAPHSTSKIAQQQDLHHIQSLGFRGEALFSLTQLADVEILSRCADAHAWRLCYREGKQVSETSVAIAPGTIINVSNLFRDWKVRRQALGNKSSKLKNLQKMIGEMALCHPQVNWQVRLRDRLWFKISPSSNPQNILPQILKPITPQDLALQEINIPSQGEIQGEKIIVVMGLPDRTHRQRPDWVKVAVNGRMVQSSELEQTILNTTSRIFPRDRYPLCFLHLRISPSQIDWNRHPAKSEVYIHSLDFYQAQITEAIDRLLKLNPDHLDPDKSNQRVKQLFKVAETKETYSVNNLSSEIGLISLKAIAQVNQTYIVAEHPNGLWLIEQHIAHERVLYEKLQDDWRLIPLEKPIIFNLLTPKAIEQLQSLGIEVETFGEQAWAVRNAPAMLVERSDCQEALLELSQGGDLEAAQVATACRSAIRNGTPMTLVEMQNLVNAWKITRNPRTCPHGRPIYLSLEESALARFFRRHWVIGKSHGLRS